MKIIIDTEIMDDANEFGEALRNHVFVTDEHGGDYGCYSTFETRPEFKPVDEDSELGKELLVAIHGDKPKPEDDWGWDANVRATALLSNGKIHVAWYWDGDGTLLIVEQEDCGYRAAINHDCKKAHEWAWVSWV